MFTIAYHRLLDARRSARSRPVDPAPHEAIEQAVPVGDVEAERFRGWRARG